MRTLLASADFIARHRQHPRAFTRERVLPFASVVVLILQKGVKALQLRLNEFFSRLNGWATHATASAFTQARAKLAHTAFIELNEAAVVEVFYADQDYQRWRGFRLLSVDGSKIRLPESASTNSEFGQIAYRGAGGTKQYRSMAMVSVLYDVLNEIALDSVIASGTSYEVDLALGHRSKWQSGDLLLGDRQYPTYLFLSSLAQDGVDYVMRCSRSSFKAAQALFAGTGVRSTVVDLAAPVRKRAQMQARGLPLTIPVRFVRVELDTGEPEVLVTTLLDAAQYPDADFLDLYARRWGIETYYDRLKQRLDLGAFSGHSAESVRQDFYATIFLTGLESLLSEQAQAYLDAKQGQYRQRVNKAVSYHAIKHEAIDLFYRTEDVDELLEKLTRLLTSTPVLVRPGRKYERKRRAARHRLHYHRCIKKQTY